MGFHQADTFGVIFVFWRQGPEQVHVVGQGNSGDGFERVAVLDISVCSAQFDDMSCEQVAGAIIQVYGEEVGASSVIEGAIVGHV